MSEQHEQDTEHEPDDEPGTPVSPETVIDDLEAEHEVERADHAADDPTEPEPGDTPNDDDEPENVGTQASAKAERDQQKMIEKMFDSAERETKRHTTRVAEIAGDSAPDLLQCPMCTPDEGQPSFPGWLLPVPPSEEKIANVRAAIGLAPKINYREDPHSRVCSTCGGLKSVVPTGGDSATPLLPCADCGAQGWTPTDAKRGGVQTNGEVTTTGTWQSAAPPTLEPDAPEVAALKAAGYTVIAPYSAAS